MSAVRPASPASRVVKFHAPDTSRVEAAGAAFGVACGVFGSVASGAGGAVDVAAPVDFAAVDVAGAGDAAGGVDVVGGCVDRGGATGRLTPAVAVASRFEVD